MEMAVLNETSVWRDKEDVLPSKNIWGKEKVILTNREQKIEELFNKLQPLGFKMLVEDDDGIETEIE